MQDAATNTWVATTVTQGGGDRFIHGAGRKALSGELTQVNITTTAGTFDGGSVNIQYENPNLAVSGVESVAAGVTDVFVNGVQQASTSGTEIDFTIPSGVKEVSITYVDVSTNGTSPLTAQLGDSGGIETSGYGGSVSRNTSLVNAENYTVGFRLIHSGSMNAGDSYSGLFNLKIHDEATNHWCGEGTCGRTNSGGVFNSAGDKALSSELTTVRLTMVNGTDAFDGGPINIQYDNPDLDLGSGVISGGVVQQVFSQDGEVATGTTIFTLDDSIPQQSSDGDEYMSVSITPTNAANLLKIEVELNMAHSSASSGVHAGGIFQDSDEDALAVNYMARNVGTNNVGLLRITHWMTAGTTSSTTFKALAGGNGAGTTTFNGRAGSRDFGGTLASTMTVTEYKV